MTNGFLEAFEVSEDRWALSIHAWERLTRREFRPEVGLGYVRLSVGLEDG